MLLRQWRVDAKYTQRALAKRLHKPHSYIWKVEVGERRIDPLEFIAWCRACEVSPGKAIARLEEG